MPMFLVILLLWALAASSTISALDSLTRNSYLSVENPQDVLRSPNGIFSAGFYAVGDNAYSFAVWFDDGPNSAAGAVVWMANRDYPANGKHSRLSLLKSGNLVLTDADKSTIWATGTASDIYVELLLYDTGNLVLRDSESVELWQSFEFPTDTLLPLQKLTRFIKIVSSRSQSNQSTGFYQLYFDDDNILRLLYDGPDVSNIYWPSPWLLSTQAGRTSYNNSRMAFFDSLGNFTSSDGFVSTASDYGRALQRRLKIEYDGNVRMYSREHVGDDWYVSWQLKVQPCQIHGLCGPNGYCTYDPGAGAQCKCIPGYKRKNVTDWSYGCEPSFELSCNGSDRQFFVPLGDFDFYGNDYDIFSSYTLDECKSKCSNVCSCKGFQHSISSDGTWSCYLKTQLQNGAPNFNGPFYVKLSQNGMPSNPESLPELSVSDTVCSNTVRDIQLDRTYAKRKQNSTVKFMLWFVCGMGAFEIIIIVLLWFFFFGFQPKSSAHSHGNFYAAAGFTKFGYKELKKATKGFSQEIGKGAGGTVYIGELPDGRIAAVKCLNGADQGEQEFLAEVNVIGKLNHMNLIEMWGYCVHGKHRLLVFEYMERGSLAKNLQSIALNWSRRYEIALGMARGLAYLHEECLEWILHCDVKPENILLDNKYQPKIADFGLSKLHNRSELNEANFSRIRGTRGYMAPEWVFNLPITSKVDVYSYGIVVLEMLTGRNPAMDHRIAVSEGQEQDVRLVTWVKEKRCMGSVAAKSWIEQIIDPTVEGNFDVCKMEILFEVALQCVNDDKDARPTMRQVVEILEKH